jgi:hypothetical protein
MCVTESVQNTLLLGETFHLGHIISESYLPGLYNPPKMQACEIRQSPPHPPLLIGIHTRCKLFILLRAGVQNPCLHGPENWFMRQLSEEPKPV